MSEPSEDDLAALPLARLRELRTHARHSLEIAVLRSRQPGAPASPDVARLRARVDALTEEVIRRYAADLSLVDSLLEAAYPQPEGQGRPASAPVGEGGAA